jgi:hypothetical protein
LQTSIKGLGDSGAFVVPSDGDGGNMRKPDPASAAARKTSLPAGSRGDAPVELVCLALVLALLALASRIASIW